MTYIDPKKPKKMMNDRKSLEMGVIFDIKQITFKGCSIKGLLSNIS